MHPFLDKEHKNEMDQLKKSPLQLSVTWRKWLSGHKLEDIVSEHSQQGKQQYQKKSKQKAPRRPWLRSYDDVLPLMLSEAIGQVEMTSNGTTEPAGSDETFPTAVAEVNIWALSSDDRRRLGATWLSGLRSRFVYVSMC